MKAYVMDAFSSAIFGGNQAGIVLPSGAVSDETMQRIAAEFKHSETAFVTFNDDESIGLRYFTPAGEVELCAHATVASFVLLRLIDRISDGRFTLSTKAGRLNITVSGSAVLMDMAPPRLLRTLDEAETAELYSCYGLSPADRPAGLAPQVVSTGLADIIMPVADRATLLRAVQDEPAVKALSARLKCVGVHMFTPGGSDCTAYCSNFAPLYGIPEECATGTANGALTYYLYLNGMIRPEKTNVFIQGEHMGRPSKIESRLLFENNSVKIQIGGTAVMSMECDIKI